MKRLKDEDRRKGRVYHRT